MDENVNASNASSDKKESQKYIRTFSSDIDILKKGGTPDLTPFTVTKEQSVAVVQEQGKTDALAADGKQEFPTFRGLPEAVKASFDERTKEVGAAKPEGHPEEYVRTFSGDMKTLKKGGVPDLSLFRKATVIPENIVVNRSAGAPMASSGTIPAPAPAAMSTPVPAERLVAGSPLEQMPIVVPKQEVSVMVPPAPPVSTVPISVKTYLGDFSDKVKETHASAATVLAAEQDAATGAPEITPSEKKTTSLSSRLYIAAGIALLILSGTGMYFAYTRYLSNFHPVIFQFSVSSPIFVDDREQVSGVGLKLFEAITKSMERPLMPGSVRLIYTASSTDNSESVFSSLHVSAPDILRRNVNVAGSMAGIVNIGGTQSPFFILSVDSYAETFSGMLSWEPAIQEHLSQLFPLRSAQVSGIASSTPDVTTLARVTRTVARPTIAPVVKPAQSTNFTDEVVANHDVRVYRDTDGSGVMVYGYWDQTTLIIARDTAAFIEILQRLATSRAR
ncbi:MAG: hypothetical protein Q7T37_01115 [bacterium]|nr:hypothetical protein [bacterium]MDO8742238.1 hypothetical protein [bacterium]